MDPILNNSMSINVKVYGYICSIIMNEFKGRSALTVPNSFKINDLIEYLGIPSYRIGLILINESVAKDNQALINGDTIKIFPPLGGG